MVRIRLQHLQPLAPERLPEKKHPKILLKLSQLSRGKCRSPHSEAKIYCKIDGMSTYWWDRLAAVPSLA